MGYIQVHRGAYNLCISINPCIMYPLAIKIMAIGNAQTKWLFIAGTIIEPTGGFSRRSCLIIGRYTVAMWHAVLQKDRKNNSY